MSGCFQANMGPCQNFDEQHSCQQAQQENLTIGPSSGSTSKIMAWQGL
jgi:hypothetical protein